MSVVLYRPSGIDRAGVRLFAALTGMISFSRRSIIRLQPVVERQGRLVQNRYVGDAGDYGKIALLGAFACEMKVGVNWYLVEIPGERTNDGRHIGYLDNLQSHLLQCDPLLARQLKEIVHSDRHIRQLQKLLPGVIFFSELLRPGGRKRWHEETVLALKGCDLVFLDPDNGLLVPSVKKGALKSIKYLYEEEIAHYYAEGCSLFFYNHRSREPYDKYFARFARLFGNTVLKDAVKFSLRYSAYAARDYFFLVQPRHRRAVTEIAASFTVSDWGRYFSFSPGFPPQ